MFYEMIFEEYFFIMKKFFAAVLTAVMMLSLAACGKTGLDDAWTENSDDVEVTEYSDGTKEYEGKIGSTLKTAWFNFTVKDAYVTSGEIGGQAPSDGNVFVVVDHFLLNAFLSLRWLSAASFSFSKT